MGTIAQELTRIQNAKSDLKTAIEAKGVTVPSATTIDGYATLVEQIQTGATEAPENDVNFYDYDGFKVASFSIAEAKALTQAEYNAILPPTHEGLTFQEWNWTLADIQGYNRRYINIGANYVPTDGKTHIKFCPKEDGAKLYMTITATIKNKPFVVDWGDGTSEEKQASSDNGTLNIQHTYVESGEYDITIYSKNGDNTFSLNFLSNNSNGLKWIEEINTGRDLIGITCLNIGFRLSIAKQLIDKLYLSRFKCPVIVVPRDTEWNFSTIDCLSNTKTITCFPKVVPSFSGTRVYGFPADGRDIIPDIKNGGVFSASSIVGSDFVEILSLPLSLQFASQPASNVWVSMNKVNTLDIAQGWVPNYSLSFSASTIYDSFTIVDFFNKLGTTTNTITLTFGSTNLNKLTAEEKAIATNKGYTLA